MQSLSHSRLLGHTHTYATALIPFRNLPSIIRTFWSTNSRIRGTKPRKMEKRVENQKSVAVESTTRLNNPRVGKLQQLVHKESTGTNQKQHFSFFFLGFLRWFCQMGMPISFKRCDFFCWVLVLSCINFVFLL